MQKVDKPAPDADEMRPEYDFSQLREVRPRGYYAARAHAPSGPPPKIEISLWQNGLHSFWRGIEFYAQYRETHDKLVVKDAILFLHHGIELLLKEMLVRHNPYLIFEELRSVPKKQKEADKLGIPIFFLQDAPTTISYDAAIDRVSAFIKPPGLTDDLFDKMKRLTAVRNQLEHYAISEDKQVIEGLLVELIDPLVDLFEAELGNIKRNRPEHIFRIQQDLEREIQE